MFILLISLFLQLPAQASEKLPSQTLAVQFRRGNETILQYTKPGFSLDRLHNVQSLSKSILSLLTGIAVETKAISSLQENISPQLWPNDPAKFNLNFEELLSMRSGLPSTSRGSYGSWVTKKNWVNYFLQKKQNAEKPFSYSTGDSHLLAVILGKKVGGLEKFAWDKLFTPLGIKTAVWDHDPQGNVFGGNNLSLSFASVWKLGELVLNSGKYNEQQLVPASWLTKVVEKHASPPDEFVDFTVRGYGYFWWLVRVNDEDGICALGYGGQFLCLFPRIKGQFLIFSEVPKDVAKVRRHYQEIQKLLQSLVKQR